MLYPEVDHPYVWPNKSNTDKNFIFSSLHWSSGQWCHLYVLQNILYSQLSKDVESLFGRAGEKIILFIWSKVATRWRSTPHPAARRKGLKCCCIDYIVENNSAVHWTVCSRPLRPVDRTDTGCTYKNTLWYSEALIGLLLTWVGVHTDTAVLFVLIE